MTEVHTLLRTKDPFQRLRLNYGSFIGRRYPYFYFETPKAACTTTKLLLWRLEGLGPTLPNAAMVHHRAPWDPRKTPLTVSEQRALEVLTSPSVLRFFVWRDPVDRLRSTYWDKIQLGRDYHSEWAQWRSNIRNAFQLAPEQEITFDHFAAFACAVPDELRDTHFMSQGRVILADHIAYHRVVRTDDYARGMAEVLRAMGVPSHRWPPLDERQNETASSSAVTVSASAAAAIRTADYELLDQVAGQRIGNDT